MVGEEREKGLRVGEKGLDLGDKEIGLCEGDMGEGCRTRCQGLL